MKGSQACVKCNVFVSLLFMHMLPSGVGGHHTFMDMCVRACVCVYFFWRPEVQFRFCPFFYLRKVCWGGESGGTSVEYFHFPP